MRVIPHWESNSNQGKLNFRLRMKSGNYSHIVKLLLIIIGIAIAGGLSFMTLILSVEIKCPDTNDLLTIPRGATISDIGHLLEDRTCIPHRSLFNTAIKLTLNDRNIKAGRYTMKGISSMRDLVRMLTNPTADRVKVTIYEGYTISQIADLLESALDINSKHFIDLCHDHNFVQTMGISAPSLEGFLYPDTYILLTAYTEEDIIQILTNQFKTVYEKNISNQFTTSQYSMLELTTLASIIQGEAIFSDELPLISSVYHNRLKKKMLLQADPTIQYVIPHRKKRLYQKDLEIDSPYNTYKYYGLPPGPINNPGIAALIAAIQPDKTNYLYFVADGKGRHIFSHSNDEHNEARVKVKNQRNK